MTPHRIRRVAAAAALAATLAFANPAHAAGWKAWTVTPGWFESVKEWIARVWMGDGQASTPTPGIEKCGMGVDPNGGCLPPPPPPSTPSSDSGPGSDPDG